MSQNATTEQSATVTVPPESPLSGFQIFFAGFLITGAICLSLWVLAAHWPDKMPTSKNAIYRYTLMQVTLADGIKAGEVPNPVTSEGKDTTKVAVDSISLAKAETERISNINNVKKEQGDATTNDADTIHFNVLILILVATAGFLGSMVYVASSFAAFVGNGKFRRSWILWYFLKPFTASSLATFLYLALNNSNDVLGTVGKPVNLNGTIAAAALAGLFTDIATEKLRDIFTAIFKPSDNGPGRPVDQPKVISVDLNNMQPDKIDVNATNEFIIAGKNLDPKNLVVTIAKKKVDPVTITPTQISFSYDVEASDKALQKFPLLITDSKGNKIDEKELTV